MPCAACGSPDPMNAPARCLSCALARLKRYADTSQPYDAHTIRVAAADARQLAAAMFALGMFGLGCAAAVLSAVLDDRANVVAAKHAEQEAVKGPLN